MRKQTWTRHLSALHRPSLPSSPPPSVGLVFFLQCRVQISIPVVPPLHEVSDCGKQWLFLCWLWSGRCYLHQNDKFKENKVVCYQLKAALKGYFSRKRQLFPAKNKRQTPLCSTKQQTDTFSDHSSRQQRNIRASCSPSGAEGERLYIGVMLEQPARNTAKDPDGAGCISKQPFC